MQRALEYCLHPSLTQATGVSYTPLQKMGQNRGTGSVAQEARVGYFMPHKVVCGKDTMKAAGTVTKALAKWLVEKGYVVDASGAQERAKEAATDLPAAQDVLDLLEQYVDEHSPHAYQREIEDHFWIRKIEPGKLWLEPLTGPGEVLGPVPVPKEVTNICQEMWDIGGVVVKTSRGWRLREVWNVSP